MTRPTCGTCKHHQMQGAYLFCVLHGIHTNLLDSCEQHTPTEESDDG